MHFRDLGNALERRATGETPARGPDAVRVRATPDGPVPDDLPGALLDAPPGSEPVIGIAEHHAPLVNGALQRNGEVTIPLPVSDRGYGLPWNSPADGRVEPAETGTRWVADSARRIDYRVTADERAWDVEDAFRLGPDLLVTPVTAAGVRWADAWTGEEHAGGQTVTAPAPIERMPLFPGDDARLPLHEEKV